MMGWQLPTAVAWRTDGSTGWHIGDVVVGYGVECENIVAEPGQQGSFGVCGKVRKPFENHLGRSFLSNGVVKMA